MQSRSPSPLRTPLISRSSSDAAHGHTRALYHKDHGLGCDAQGRDPYAQADDDLLKEIWSVLHYYYPGHAWGVGVNHAQGIAQIFIPCLTDYSYVLHIQNLNGPAGRKKVRDAGGEFLERYKIPRAGFEISHFIKAMGDSLIAPRNRPPPE